MHRTLNTSLILSVLYFFIGLYNYEVHGENIAAMEQSYEITTDVDQRGCIPPSDMDCDEDIVDMFVPAGTLCFHVTEAGPNLICINGEWVEANSGAKAKREKRYHQICTTHRRRRRIVWRRRRSRYAVEKCDRPNHEPYFRNCPSSLTFVTGKKETSMRVYWTEPTAYDYEDGSLSIKYRYGPRRGSLLEGSKWGRTYTVSYRSRADTGGSTATCMITLKVKVIFCPTPKAPKYGTVDCSGTHYGHTCKFVCPIGHTPTVASMTCQLNGFWTHGGLSECQDNTCPQTLPTIGNGYYSCSKFTIGASCNPTCDPGYSVFRFFPIVCKLDEQWSLPVETICKDSESPIILNCPSNITMTAEKGKTSAIVTWDVPSAVDNQDNASVTVNQTAGSITPGSRIEGGVVHILKYVAFDSALNPSEECLFYVQVKITKCSRISAPKNGRYKCDKGFIYGSQCNYTCYHGYLLQGASSSTCDQNGDWNSSTPICKEVECLPPEEYGMSISNGYFICPSPIKYQSVCYSTCDSGLKLAQYTSAICKVDSNNTPFLSLSLQPVCLDIEPPTVDNCQGTKVLTFHAAKGKTTAVIQYDIPTASDNVDPSPEVTKILGPDSGDTLDANNIDFVEFQAIDNVGNVSPLCLYVLQVDVTECPAYIPPENGDVSCTSDFIYGSICTLTCNEGYKWQGSAIVQCLESKSWNATDFVCTRVLCPSLPDPPDNGYYSCAGNTFPYGTICQANCIDGFKLSQMSFARCKSDGSWEISTTPNCKDVEPPEIIDCPSEIKINAERGLESAIVTWTVPSASDNFDNSPIVMRVYGPKSGERIEDNAIVKYQATDSAGNPSDICTIYITVIVIRCPSPHWPDDGRISCNLGNIYGSECIYTCDEGYEVSFPSSAVCEENGYWTYGSKPPICSPITCGPPPSVPNGIFLCMNVMFHYQSMCMLICSNGFSTNNFVLAICQSSGEWFISSNSICKDITPPTILNCKTYQTFYTDRGLDTAPVTWSIPTAIDNTDNPSDIIIEQISGPTIGSSISIGTTVVDYRAVDTSGNPSVVTCSITINVEAVYCNHPRYHFDDVNLEYTCTSFNWGDTCSLACPLKDSLSLQGPDLITCEATFVGSSPITTWEYEGNNEPSCQAQTCPTSLTTPENGVLLYTSDNDNQPLVYVLCNGNYDLPYGFDGHIQCLYTGLWSPSEVPDCTRTRRPGLNSLPVSFYYFIDSTSEASIDAIKDQLLTSLEGYIETVKTSECLAGCTCSYNGLEVKDGSVRQEREVKNTNYRSKRQEYELFVNFSLTITGNVSEWDEFLMYQSVLFRMSDKLKNAIYAGAFDFGDLSVVPGSYHKAPTSINTCEGDGQVKDAYRCKTCVAGMFLKDVDGVKSCVKCPIGTYMEHEGASSCNLCPIGTSTNKTGAKSADMCVELCPIGFSSLTLVKPCIPCALGFYQDSLGQASCKKCQFGTTTFNVGSKHCTSYDVVLNPKSPSPIVSTLKTTDVLDEMTVLFWLFRRSGSAFSLQIESNIVIEVLGESFIINWNSVSINAKLPSPSSFDIWTHFAVSISAATVTFYYKGEIANSQAKVYGMTVPASAKVELFAKGENDILLNSLAIYKYAMEADEITSHHSSCRYDISAANFTSDDIVLDNSVIQREPSSCAATNFCADDPCDQHMCTNTQSGFLCTCSGGFRGTRCEFPPDSCNENECLNGATCVSGSYNYTCVCKPGYRGVFCQTPPINGGWSLWASWGECTTSCDGGVRRRNRTCDNPSPGQYGKQCVGDVMEQIQCNTDPCNITSPCLSSPCGKNRCVERSNGFECQCNSGFTGNLCQTPVDHCDPNPCENRGSCQNNANNFTCICTELFQGEVCDEATVFTSYWTTWSRCTVTCGGGVSIRSRVCPHKNSCNEQTESRLCNNAHCVVNSCQSSPCGTNLCISSEDGFKCTCDAGFTGIRCDTPIDFCDENRCEHGQCNNKATGYECLCDEGYNGHLCDVIEETAGWGLWTEWNACSSTCGLGQRQRNRLCDNPPPLPGGNTCDGDEEETEACSTDCYDACSSNRCGDIHRCISDGTGYKCQCKDGYSGVDCSLAPDYCQPNPCENSGKCVSSSDGFICTCVDGFSGSTCDVLPDTSVWEPWSEWSSCSVTCGKGEQSRQRECKLGTNGNECSGYNTEERVCDEDSCPTCPTLGNPYGMVKTCEKTEEVTTCTLRCLPGYFPPNSTYSSENWTVVYQCSPFSSYTWNTTAVSPSCTKTSGRPRHIDASASMAIFPQISCGKSSACEIFIRNLVYGSICQRGISCTVIADVTQCGNRKRRQTSTDNSEITLTFAFEFDNETDSGNTNITVCVSKSDTSNINMTEYWDAIEDSLSPLSTNSGDWLTIVIDDVTYVADTANITKGANLECSSGYFLQDEYDICVGCSPGTMYDARHGYCISCPLGTYQELAAQSSCVSCPESYTTNITGSYDQYDCYYTEKAANNGDVDGFYDIIGAVLGSCLVVILVAVSVAIIVKVKRVHLKNKIHDSAADMIENRPQSHEEMRSRLKSVASIQSTSHIPLSVEDIN